MNFLIALLCLTPWFALFACVFWEAKKAKKESQAEVVPPPRDQEPNHCAPPQCLTAWPYECECEKAEESPSDRIAVRVQDRLRKSLDDYSLLRKVLKVKKLVAGERPKHRRPFMLDSYVVGTPPIAFTIPVRGAVPQELPYDGDGYVCPPNFEIAAHPSIRHPLWKENPESRGEELAEGTSEAFLREENHHAVSICRGVVKVLGKDENFASHSVLSRADFEKAFQKIEQSGLAVLIVMVNGSDLSTLRSCLPIDFEEWRSNGPHDARGTLWSAIVYVNDSCEVGEFIFVAGEAVGNMTVDEVVAVADADAPRMRHGTVVHETISVCGTNPKAVSILRKVAN